MATEYEWAGEVEAVAKDIIATVDEHADLVHATILYVFRDKHSTSRGRVVLGKARKFTGLTKFLIEEEASGPLFVVEVAQNLWTGMTEEARRALVDHELSHLAVERQEDGTWVGRTRGHDVEEFLGVVERHGLWKADVAALATTAASKLEQLTLDLVGGGVDPDGDG